MALDSLDVIIRNRELALYEGPAYAVSSINEVGPFDVLPEHENFVTSVQDHVIIHKGEKSLQEVKIDRGIMRVKENKIEIYVGI